MSRAKKRILLISASTELEAVRWIDKSAKDIDHAPAYVAPLSIASVAALTPSDIQVQLWDEVVQGPADANLDAGYDLVGITGYSDHLKRGLEVARAFKATGATVVMGGAGISAAPHRADGIADAVFVGEAEQIWPQFLIDWEAGNYARRYVSDGSIDLATSPPPKWDSIAHLMPKGYKSGSVETSRGCPFSCEFCDVWKKFGRTMRTKPIDQVRQEVATLERIGMKRIYLATDNFIGSPKYAKSVLRELIALNAEFRYPLTYMAEVTLNVARDDVLLAMMADANFSKVLIGLESTSVESLRETRKIQNIRGDMAEECRRVQSYGIAVLGSMIVGFDHDLPSCFDDQFEFIQAALIPIPRLNILRALDGTDLYDRLRLDGRVIDVDATFCREDVLSCTLPTNLDFANMSRAEVYAGFLRLSERVWDWANFEERMIGFIDNMANLPPRQLDDRLAAVVPTLQATMRELPESDAKVIDHVIDHARERVPSQLWEIAADTMIQCFHASQMPGMRTMVHRQVELEEKAARSGGYVYEEPPAQRRIAVLS